MPEDKLPEEFAPTGPKLSRFPILPAPPIRPHLFPDEARFALRLAVLCGATDFVAWFMVAGAGGSKALLALASLRLLKPAWARLGTRLPRPAVALGSIATTVLVWVAVIVSILKAFDIGFALSGLMVVAAGLPSLSDLCSTTVADSVTVERRAAGFAWLDMGQGLGAVLGLSLPRMIHGEPLHSVLISFSLLLGALLIAAIFSRELHDRGTPRSSFPLTAYWSALRSPLGLTICMFAFACGALALFGTDFMPPPLWNGMPIIPLKILGAIPSWLRLAMPLAGMVVAARLEAFTPNARTLFVASTGAAAVGLVLSFWPLSAFGLGIMFSAIPAAVARAAGEMERPIVSSLAWSALFLGAAIGAML
jgi:hypothetical protein